MKKKVKFKRKPNNKANKTKACFTTQNPTENIELPLNSSFIDILK